MLANYVTNACLLPTTRLTSSASSGVIIAGCTLAAALTPPSASAPIDAAFIAIMPPQQNPVAPKTSAPLCSFMWATAAVKVGRIDVSHLPVVPNHASSSLLVLSCINTKSAGARAHAGREFHEHAFAVKVYFQKYQKYFVYINKIGYQ